MSERFKERRARLAQLEKELVQLKKQRKVLERDVLRDEPDEWQELRRGTAKPEARASEPAPEPKGAAPETASPREEGERERFASYFMTGSLGRAAPQLRRERRAMRNKAIVMALFALVLLIALVRFWVK